MLFYDFLYTTHKDVWTLLVYTSVPWGQNRTACSLLPVNKHLSTDRRLIRYEFTVIFLEESLPVSQNKSFLPVLGLSNTFFSV